MKQLTTFLLLIALILQGEASLAQIDEAKMERDLRVASGVLASLVNYDHDHDHIFREREPEANYIEGYGVIFTIEDNVFFKYNYKMQYQAGRKAQKEAQKAISDAYRAQKEAEREVRSSARSKDNDIVVIPPMPPIPDIEVNIGVDDEEMEKLKEKSEKENELFNKNLRESFETFLVDYSQLIGQLKPTDKILLSTKTNSFYDFAYYMGGREYGNKFEKSRLSAEMLVKDRNDFQSGKLSREKLLAKIKFVENAEMERKPDLDLFGNMLKTTYNSKYTETYFISSIPKYERLTGLGVVYSVQVFSSYPDGRFFRMPGNKKAGLSEEERNKAVEEMYPLFVEGFKENMIRYGSTIKSLDSGDKLIVKIKMTKCDTCTFPDTIEFIVGKSVLGQFSKGSLTLDQAKNKVKLK